MASSYGEKARKKALQLRKLQQIILRAVYNGHFDSTSEAIEVLAAHFSEGLPHDGRQLLDFFPEKDRVRFYAATLLIAQTSLVLQGGHSHRRCIQSCDLVSW